MTQGSNLRNATFQALNEYLGESYKNNGLYVVGNSVPKGMGQELSHTIHRIFQFNETTKNNNNKKKTHSGPVFTQPFWNEMKGQLHLIFTYILHGLEKV